MRLNVMAGLVPAIHVLLIGPMNGGFIYMMSNARNGTLYVGVAGDLLRRCHEHRNGLLHGFTKRYGLKRLVYSSGTTISALQSSARKRSSIGRALGRCG